MGETNSKTRPKVEPVRRREKAGNASENGKVWLAENLQNKHQLGRGPHAYVVEAVNIKTNQKCAIKVFEYNTRDDPLYQYAIEKARKAYQANKIRSPNIAKTYVCQAIEVENNFSLKNRFVIIMELFEQNLGDLMLGMKNVEKVFSEQQIIRFGFELARALASCHRQSFYHGNLKEENVFVANNGTSIKLGDFDIPFHPDTQKPYKQLMAPELYQQRSDLTEIDLAKVDCFALGVLLAKIAAGETSVISENEDLLRLLEKVDALYTKRLVVIMKRLTAANPNERWSAERLFKSLQEDYMLQNITEADFDELLSEEQRSVQELIEKGLAYRKAEDHFLAIETFEKAKEALMRTPSMNQYDRTLCANCLHNVASTYYDIKDYSKSITNHLLCLDLKKKYLGGLDVFNSYGNIGKAYTKLGSPQKGLMYYLKAYAAAKRLKGEMKLPNMVKSLDNIACTYESIGDHQNALENHLICLEIVKILYGETNSRYAKTLRNISRTLRSLNRFEDAKVFELKAKKINY